MSTWYICRYCYHGRLASRGRESRLSAYVIMYQVFSPLHRGYSNWDYRSRTAVNQRHHSTRWVIHIKHGDLTWSPQRALWRYSRWDIPIGIADVFDVFDPRDADLPNHVNRQCGQRRLAHSLGDLGTGHLWLLALGLPSQRLRDLLGFIAFETTMIAINAWDDARHDGDGGDGDRLRGTAAVIIEARWIGARRCTGTPPLRHGVRMIVVRRRGQRGDDGPGLTNTGDHVGREPVKHGGYGTCPRRPDCAGGQCSEGRGAAKEVERSRRRCSGSQRSPRRLKVRGDDGDGLDINGGTNCADRGNGVLRWLLEDSTDSDIGEGVPRACTKEVPSCTIADSMTKPAGGGDLARGTHRHRDDVRYSGIVPLLGLRGGGGHDDEHTAGRCHEERQHDRGHDEQGSTLNFCATCRGQIPLDGEDWSSCVCGATICEPCMYKDCLTCDRKGNTLPVDFIAAAQCQQAAARWTRGDGTGPRITGVVNERRVYICNFCMGQRWVDVDEGDTHRWWATGFCGRCRRDDHLAHPRPDGQTTSETDPGITRLQLPTFLGTEVVTPTRGSAGRGCAECGIPLDGDGAWWRICSCFSTVCMACPFSPCAACRVGHATASAQEAQITSEGFDHAVDVPGGSPANDMCGGATLSGEQHEGNRITPAQAVERRNALLAQHREWLYDRRAYKRIEARKQVAEGKRPARRRASRNETVYVCCNATAASTFDKELTHGTTLLHADCTMVQEHGLDDERGDAMVTQLRKRGWDAVAEGAYVKSVANGGGVAVLSKAVAGIRPCPIVRGAGGSDTRILEGRYAAGITSDYGGLLNATLYGLSGLAPAEQLRLWHAVIAQIRLVGLPFILGADWQVTPQELEATGLHRTMGAVVVAPSEPTNLVTMRTIDYYLVDKALSPYIKSVRVIHGTLFSPHAPVLMAMRGARSLGTTRRIARPRILDVHRPHGPMPEGVQIDWSDWDNDDWKADGVARSGGNNSQQCADGKHPADDAVDQWFAAASVELMTVYGKVNTEEEPHYCGIGMPPREVEGTIGPAKAETPCKLGMLGHRLAWSARALRLILRWAAQLEPPRRQNEYRHPLPLHGDKLQRIIRTLQCYGHRATAMIREPMISARDGTTDDDYRDTLKRALRLIATVVRSCHRRGPLIPDWSRGLRLDCIVRFAAMEREVADAIAGLCKARRAKELKRLRGWARSAPLKLAHAVTKPRETACRYTASAAKHHQGEMTAQDAADKGLSEWSRPWKASDVDRSGDVLKLVSDAYDIGPEEWAIAQDGILDEIELPDICEGRLLRWARRFKGDTGLSMDALRPRHIALLTMQAIRALARLLMRIERSHRWPSTLRGVVAAAIAKRTGGSRLIGVAGAIYRLWTKVRYDDIKEQVESRLARPFLSAAPGVGAERAAVEAALFAEVATARGLGSAISIVDMSQYFEQITHSELASGAAAFGLPRQIIALALSLYSGPRRIKVGNAWSKHVYPTRSVLPGCTWAMLLIRAVTIAPAERFVALLNQKSDDEAMDSKVRIYVDDVFVATAGPEPVVARIHPWCTKRLVHWVEKDLGKMIAPSKRQCVASSARLRKAISPSMARIGFPVDAEGELLGTDFTAGGVMRRRRAQNKRVKKVARRRGRLRWWRRLGGDAVEVSRGGAIPAVIYGAAATGLPPAALRTARRVQGAMSRIGASGASLTAKLAIGGANYRDVDPAVAHPAPPLKQILAILWEKPQERKDFVEAWRKIAIEFKTCGEQAAWRLIRGPISAAWAHLKRINLEWVSPFVMRALDHDIDLITTPPRPDSCHHRTSCAASLRHDPRDEACSRRPRGDQLERHDGQVLGRRRLGGHQADAEEHQWRPDTGGGEGHGARRHRSLLDRRNEMVVRDARRGHL